MLNIPGILLITYLISKPFYLFPSGGLQIADLIMLVILLYNFTLTRWRVLDKSYSLIAMLFLFYVTVINLISITLYGFDIMYIKNIFFYTFNIMIFITMVELISRKKITISHILTGITLSLVVQFMMFALFSFSLSGSRVELFFNNPNQLGYYGLISGVLILLIMDLTESKKIHWIALMIAAFAVLISLSKAAIVSFAVAIAFYFLIRFGKHYKKVILVFLIVLLVPLLTQADSKIEVDEFKTALVTRISNIGRDSDDSLAYRGYDRIGNHKEYIIFGSGEGNYERFDSVIRGGEIHSTLANILFSYGIVGLMIFSWLILKIYRNQVQIFTYTFFPIILYGITHNGIRSSLLWIMLSLIACYNYKERSFVDAKGIS